MDYVRLTRGKAPAIIAEGPGPLPRAWRNLSGFDKLPPDELARYGWYPFQGEPEPACDAHREKVVRRLSLDGGVVRSSCEVVALSEAECLHLLAERRREILAELPAIRYRNEVAGIVFEGIPLHTDRESQATIALAALQGTRERWKGADGKWYDLTPERLQAAAAAVAGHKRACFAREEALAGEIRAADSLEALEGIDLERGWP